MKKQMTLCIVAKDDEVLLGMKKRGFGEGRWNGFGGKVAGGETVKEAAVRELQEEAGIITDLLDQVGLIEFSFENDPKILEVHIFKISDFQGEITESEEMRPEWFKISEIPFNQMWSDDEYWFPYFLEGKLFKGKFHFDKPSNSEYSAKILDMEIGEVDSL